MNPRAHLCTWLPLLAVLCVSVPARAAESGPGKLDGKTFDVTVVEEGTKKTEKDQLIFKAGSFESTDCRAYGFQAAAYTSEGSGEDLAFQATTQSPQEGTIRWEGMVRGGLVEGRFLWEKTGQAPIRYHFTGKLAAAPAAAAPAP